MLLEYWHTTYLEEGVSECSGSQHGGDGAVTLESAMLLEYWHTTNLEEGMCESGGGQTGSDGALIPESGDALGVLAYNIPGGRRV
jgi:hypothetical protein